MCGFAGFVGHVDLDYESVLAMLDRMGDDLANLGLDEAGKLWDESDEVGLVHRRLSNLDLSRQSLQPMTSPCGRF